MLVYQKFHQIAQFFTKLPALGPSSKYSRSEIQGDFLAE